MSATAVVEGHDAAWSALRAAARGARLHHAWLLHGPRGVGKASWAAAAAAWLLAHGTGEDPDGELPADHPTARLIAAGAHPDLHRLERLTGDRGTLARSITVDQVRGLRAALTGTPSQGARRVVLVDAVDDLERGGANALLKSLEEPPASTVFLLVSHAPGRLLPTIRSRTRALAFAPLADDAMARVLARRWPDADAVRIERLVARSGGAPGEAVSLHEDDALALEGLLERVMAEGPEGTAARLALGATVARREAAGRYHALLRLAPRFIAARARALEGDALARALVAWEGARDLAADAVAQSLPPEDVAVALGAHVATLAAPGPVAKA